MTRRPRPEEAIGFECAWPQRLPTSLPVYPAAGRWRWVRWAIAAAVLGTLVFLGWRLGLAGWPELVRGFPWYSGRVS